MARQRECAGAELDQAAVAGNRAVEGQWYKTRDCYSEGYRFKLDPVIETALTPGDIIEMGEMRMEFMGGQAQ